MKWMIWLLALAAFAAHADPTSLPRLKEALKTNSPCVLAAAQTPDTYGTTSSTVYCIMAKASGDKLNCVMVGYDTATDRFVNIPGSSKKEIQVGGSCFENGVDELLNKQLNTTTLKQFLRRNAKLAFAADDSFAKKYFDGDPYGLQEFKAGPKARPRQGGFSLTGGSHSGGLESMPADDFGLESMQIPREETYTTVTLHYATNRKSNGADRPAKEIFGDERSEDGSLTYGTLDVSIPKTHQRGSLEAASFFSFQYSASPDKHVVLQKVTQVSDTEFFGSLNQRINQPGNDEKAALVFVHGFLNTFEDASRRAAQIAYDLNFPGAPILFSWPSGDSVLKYPVGEVNAEWSTRHFKKFLMDVASKSGAQKITVIAHSMGNRLLVNALAQYGEMMGDRLPGLERIILAAPDVDTGTFRQLDDDVIKAVGELYLYGSDGDEALKVLAKFHAHPRLGETDRDVFVSKHATGQTIDASKCETALDGHSYIGNSPEVLTDVAKVLSKSLKPKDRGLKEMKTDKGQTFWRIEK